MFTFLCYFKGLSKLIKNFSTFLLFNVEKLFYWISYFLSFFNNIFEKQFHILRISQKFMIKLYHNKYRYFNVLKKKKLLYIFIIYFFSLYIKLIIINKYMSVFVNNLFFKLTSLLIYYDSALLLFYFLAKLFLILMSFVLNLAKKFSD